MKSKIITIFLFLKLVIYDAYVLFRDSLTFNRNTRDQLLAMIMLNYHSLEKGLSFQVKKDGWGENKAFNLVNLINKFIDLYGHDNRIDLALCVLHNYVQDEYSSKEIQLISKIKQLLENNNYLFEVAGIKKVTKPNFNIEFRDICEFYETRSSVREFSEESLTNEEIQNVFKLVSTTPSACNRQACSLYTINDAILIKELIDNQLGDQGWCLNARSLFIVTSKQSYYNATYERFEPFIDGGMFAMNVVMALHGQRIASCCKMFVNLPSLEKKVKVIAGIPDSERPIIIILAGHYKNISSESPLSYKLRNY